MWPLATAATGGLVGDGDLVSGGVSDGGGDRSGNRGGNGSGDRGRGCAVTVRPAEAADLAGAERVRLTCFPRVFDVAMGRGATDRKVRALVALRRCRPDPAAGLVVAVSATGDVVGCASVAVHGAPVGSLVRRTWAVLRSLGPVRTARFVTARQRVFLRHDVRPGEAYVSDVAVLASWRGARLGERLVTAAELAARSGTSRPSGPRGVELLVALVEEQNVPSLALFRRLGYAEGATVRHPTRARLVGEGVFVRLERRV